MPQVLPSSKRYTGRHADNCRAALQDLLHLNKDYNVYIYWSKVQRVTLKNARNWNVGKFESKADDGWWAYTYDYLVFDEGTIVWDGPQSEDKLCFTKDNYEKIGDEYRFQLRSRAKVDWADWMGQLRQRLGPQRQQQLYLSSLTLPSTHNSHATSSNVSNWLAWGGSVANCQAVGVKQQLEMGVRSIDLRVGKGLRLRHGKVELKGHLRDVLRDMSEFLDRHPAETIMFQAKWDYWGDDRAPDEEQAPAQVAELIRSEFSARGLVLDAQPRLSECVGKMVLYNDNGKGAWAPSGGPGAPGSAGGTDLEALSDCEAYWRNLHSALEWMSTRTDIYDGLYYEIGCGWQTLDRFNDWNKSWAHFLALSKATRPCTFAEFINPRVYDWLRRNRNRGRLGRVTLDFAAEDMVHEILLWNFDYQFA